MATFTATRAAATKGVAQFRGGGVLQVAHGTYTLTGVLTAADIIEMCRVPANATVTGGWLYGADIDTGIETLDLDVGWAANADEVADPDGFGNFGVLSGDVITELKPVAGILNPLQGVLLTAGPKTFASETVITITYVAASNAGHVGALTVVVYYTVE